MNHKKGNFFGRLYLWAERIFAFLNIFSQWPRDIESARGFRDLFKTFLKLNRALRLPPPEKCSELLKALSLETSLTEENAQLFRSAVCYSEEILRASSERLNLMLSERYNDKSCPKILIISHELSRTGAPKAALELSIAVRAFSGCPPVVMTLREGPMRAEFEKESIAIYNFYLLPFRDELLKAALERFDFIIVNSWAPQFMIKISKLQLKTPLVWWSHEVLEKPRDIALASQFVPFLSACWAGSPLTLEFLERNFPKTNTELLIYGLPEISLEKAAKEKIVIASMGTICKRKGHDVFIEAIRLIPKDLRKRAEFFIIGGADAENSKYLQKLRSMGAGIEELKFVDELSFQDLLKYYSFVDVLVTASRLDPMPIVATYGLMFQKLCVVSNGTGTSRLMTHGKDGFIFKNEDSKGLSLIMQQLISEPSRFAKIALNGFGTYNDYFSKEKFLSDVEKKIQLLNTSKEREFREKIPC
jgi:glycosyltransferase involved in cell wall biosynthesis